MASGSKKQQAKELAKDARGNIKSKRLIKSGTGITGGLIPSNYLSEQPFIDYLTSGEQPHFFFYNESKGIAIGDTRVRAGWSGDYRSGMWITDKGIHFTVGKDSGDFHDFIPYSSIDSFEAREGVTKNKFIFQTNRGEARFPTDPSQDPGPAERYISKKLTSQSANRPSPASSQVNAPSDNSLSSLQQIDGYEFEQVVADLWEKQGWDATVTQGSSDRGVDVVAVKQDPFEQRQLIQAKRYSDGNNVGSSEIQKYSGLYTRDERVDAVAVVTTSNFTREAKRVAAERDVKTINGEELVEMMEKHGKPKDNTQYSANSGNKPKDNTQYSVKDSPFNNSKNWKNVNPNQTHFEKCPECDSESVWFGKLKGDRHLQCESCNSKWKKEEREEGGWLSSSKKTGWVELRGPNKGAFQPKSSWSDHHHGDNGHSHGDGDHHDGHSDSDGGHHDSDSIADEDLDRTVAEEAARLVEEFEDADDSDDGDHHDGHGDSDSGHHDGDSIADVNLDKDVTKEAANLIEEMERPDGDDDSDADVNDASDDEEIRGQLADMDLYVGQPHGEDVYATVLYSEADTDELFEEVDGLRGNFDHYGTHVKTAVYEAADRDRSAVVSIWDTASAADTAAGFLSELPDVVERADEESGFGTMGMFYTVKPDSREDFVDKFDAVGGVLAEMDGHLETDLMINEENENDMFIASQWESQEDAMGFFHSDDFQDTVKWGRNVLADRPRHVFLT